METLTIRINTRSDKGKQLLGLINELAKEGTVKIQNVETYKEVITSIKEMRAGKIKPIEELFK